MGTVGKHVCVTCVVAMAPWDQSEYYGVLLCAIVNPIIKESKVIVRSAEVICYLRAGLMTTKTSPMSYTC